MALSLRRGVVSAIVERVPGLVRLEVDGVACVGYPRLTGDVQVGDDVLVNEGARLLGLGSGGFDVLYANLTRGLGLVQEEGAHVMALPYSPGQLALPHAEEEGELPVSLEGLPVVLCTLHSQVAPVCAALRGLRVAYVQVGGGALPVSLSDAVRALRARGLLAAAVAVAPCFDGDIQCVGAAAALAWAVREEHDAAVCSVGPGIVGTGSRLGHGALALADVANAAAALGGRPVLAVRASEADPRERHHGVSHHARAVLDLCLADVATAPPDDAGSAGWREACAGLPLEHMGRGPDEDATFFRSAYAAGLVARELAGGRGAVAGGTGGVVKPERRQTVWEGKLFDVVREEWDGAVRELVEHPGSVAVVAFDAEGRLVLARQLREAVGEALLELPAGVLDEGEDELEAAQRELREETGLRGGSWRRLRLLHPSPGFLREPVTLFLAEGLEEGERDLDDGEEVELVRVPATELAALVDRLEDAKTLAGLLLVLRERGGA